MRCRCRLPRIACKDARTKIINPNQTPHDHPSNISRHVTRGGIALSVLVASWYGMMAVHEFGHVLAGIVTGGSVERIAFPLLGFSRTDIHPNPHPLIVAWAGPTLGALLPLLLWAFARRFIKRRTTERILRFFAGFCLLANGVYLGLGWIDRIGDAGDLQRHGATTWQLITFGVACTLAAFILWHGLGPCIELRKLETKQAHP